MVCIWHCLHPWIVRRAVTASYSALGSHCPAWRKFVELHGGVGASRAREEEGQVVIVPGSFGAEGPYRSKVAGGPREVACPHLVLTAMNAVVARTLGKVPRPLAHFFK